VHDSVTVHMQASPEAVWELVSDVTRIGEYSPETFEAKWIDGATGPAAGARFKGHVRRNGWWPVHYWTTCRVVASEPGKEFTFAVEMQEHKPINTWSYTIVPAGDGCDVTESFQLADTGSMRIYWKLLGWARGRTNRNGMRTTLERIKAVAESAA
jgi:uncharacterized protein YndB with AHSA1/START domain